MTQRPQHRFAHSLAHRLLLGLALASISLAASAQSWEYKSYKKDKLSGQYDMERFIPGTISVEEKDGKAFFRMVAGAVDACYRGAVPVTMERGADELVITSQQPVAGCEEFRYHIRTDGSGGYKEVRREGGSAWVKSRFDHGLTPAK